MRIWFPVGPIGVLALVSMALWLAAPAPLLATYPDNTVSDPSSAPRQHIRFAHLTTADGLSQNGVRAILQDRHGFLWFGTYDGLNRYDGYEFTVYRSNPDDPTSLGQKTVFSLYEDEQGFLWVGTAGAGLNKFNPRTETFTHYTHDPDDPTSISDSMVVSFAPSWDGTFWVGTVSGGLNRFDPETETFTRYEHDPTDPASVGAGIIWDVLEDSSGTLWVGTASDGLGRFDPETETFTRYEHDPTDSASLSSNGVASIYEDQDGVLWIGTWEGGLNRFDPAAETFTRYEHDPTDATSLGNTSVAAMIEDAAGNLWVGTAGALNLFDRENETFTRYEHDPADPTSFANSMPWMMYEDREGLIWVGTDIDGLHRFSRTPPGFALYQHDPDDPNSIVGERVRAIYADPDGMLWVGTEAGLNQINRETGVIRRYRRLLDTSAPSIDAVRGDARGFLWIGTAAGLYRFDPDTQVLRQYVPDSDHALPEAPRDIGALYIAADQSVWFGAHNGLYRLEPLTNELTHYPPYPDVQSFENHVGSITIDQEGYFWLGSWYGGLSRFDPDTGQFVHYRHNTEQIDSLASDAVWSVLEDQDGTLWVGTANALDRLNRDSGTFTHYTESDGLASSALRCMQESKQGDLWISTLNGLSQFDPRDETVTNYDVTDGLQSNEFLYDACHQSSQGELFFGGPKGLNAFFPAQITTNSYQPPVLLTTMRLFNEPVGVGDAHLERPIWDTEHLTLAPDDAVVSFEFAALSYAAPQHNRYQYMLKGYEEQWNTVDSRRRFATYTNLPAGSYTLRVRGSNDDGIWSDAEIALNITVLPAWWETWWFRLAVAAAIIALIIGSIRWRLAAIRKHARLLEQQVAERTEALRISNEQLREAEANLARAHSVAGLGSWEWDMQEQVTWSEMMYHLYGQDPQQFEPQLDSIMRIVHPDDRDTTTALIRGMLEHRQPVTYTHRVCLADGSIRYHYGRCELFCDSEGNPQRIVGTVQDITDHTKQEQQLLEQHKALTILRERERLARELHDNLGQVLGYVHTQAQAVHEALAVNKVPFAMQMIEQITDAARHVLADIREYILGVQVGISLQPDAVQSVPQGAFLSSLETYLHEFEHATGILVTLDAPDAARETNFPPTVEAHLLRVIQEALTNIRKHARASSVDMRLLLHQTSETASDAEDEEDTEDLSHLVVTITDDGIGFLPSSLDRHTASTGNGFGLTSMRGRVTELGGTLDIDSAPNQGTTLTIQVPLQRHSAGGYHSARVLLADNNDLFLQGLHNLLASNGFQVVGMTNSGCDALEQARTLKPDVVLIDVHMPDINGLEATRRIKAELPDMQIVMLTVSDDDAHIFEAIRAGASGYLLKNLESEQLCTQLHKLLQGEVPLSSKVTSRILKALAQQEPVVSSDTASPPADSSTLSEQNITILSLVAQGYTYKRVAEMLNYSEVTIKRHMRSIIRKLRVTNRADAIAYARERIERGEWPEPDLDNITSE